MLKGDFVIWSGIADRLIGTIQADIGLFSRYRSLVKRLDGTEIVVDNHRLRPCPTEYVDWAIQLGGTTVPLTGKPPIRIVGK